LPNDQPLRNRHTSVKELYCRHLNRGETGRVTVEVPAERLRYWSTEKKQYVVESGKYEFLIGAASNNIRLKLPMTITAR
jgi:hypothetical protein